MDPSLGIARPCHWQVGRLLHFVFIRIFADEFYPGLEGINLSSPSKSMPDITVDQNYDARGYYGNTDLPPAATFLPQNMYARYVL